MYLRPETSKTASVLNYIETNEVEKEHYLIRPKTSKTASVLNQIETNNV